MGGVLSELRVGVPGAGRSGPGAELNRSRETRRGRVERVKPAPAPAAKASLRASRELRCNALALETGGCAPNDSLR